MHEKENEMPISAQGNSAKKHAFLSTVTVKKQSQTVDGKLSSGESEAIIKSES